MDTPLHILLIIYFFVIGAVFGSFLNMLVYRVHCGMNLFGRSFCDKTKKQLHPSDLIPIFSYIRYKGRCRECGEKLPLIYPVIEIITGVLSALIYIFWVVNNGVSYNLMAIIPGWALLFSLVFIFLFFGYYDYLYWEVDELSVRIALGYVIILNIINWILSFSNSSLPFFGAPASHLYGGLLLAGIIGITFFVTKGGGMGAGDIYLFGITGLVLGLEGGIVAFMLINIFGSIMGLIKAAKARKLKGLKIQFGPFIAAGTILVLFLKEQILKFFFLYPF